MGDNRQEDPTGKGIPIDQAVECNPSVVIKILSHDWRGYHFNPTAPEIGR